MAERVNQLKEEVTGLFGACKNVTEKLNLVDTLQHLGIDHLFEEPIATTLSSIHNTEFNSSSLHEVALRFRLLRQHGFWVSADEFNKFKHEDGSFVNDITDDPKALLSLYNAANLLTHNEGPLEEALLFARRHLQLIQSNLKSPLDEQVGRALKIPLPRNLKREEAISYIHEYNVQDEMYNASMHELAKLEFNRLQRVHQKELKAISRWWKDLYGDIKLDYARDRIVECYFWSYSCLYEEEYARSRIVLAKLLKLISLLDDTYDEHATLEECRVLSKAIERWDERDVSLLPEYLKKFFLKVISTFREFDELLEPHEKYRSAYIRNAFQNISKRFLQEAEWSHHDYTPSFNEQVNVSVKSAGGESIAVGLLFGLGGIATKEVFEWAIRDSDTVRSCGEVSRFMDDMADFKRGRNKMDVATSVECYIKENNVTGEVALAKIASLVDDAWKTLNQELFEHRAILPIVQQVTNFARSMMFLYHDKRDGYTNSKEVKDALENHYVKHLPI
ncbi:alpha-humulene synthase-like [Panicum miliaceum]|uniref:Alpha-humulene synthase-like n=1 Tax=Panicum miliaceum TaxID=4540 RepID=A0A3L6Q2J1_PANMI|nr:alpha-humulene synthase-like [Panicum miliaceum]